MLCFFVFFASCWGPVFHQIVASEFSNEFLPHLTKKERQSFIVGSVFIDSLPRNPYHKTDYMIEVLRKEPNNTEEWWFKQGMLLHLVADLFGHFGKPNSFLPLKKPIHYLAELSCCSYLTTNRNYKRIKVNQLSKKVLKSLGNRFPLFFTLFIKVWRILCYFWVHKIIHHLESDTCSKIKSYDNSVDVLENHISSIKSTMYEILILFSNNQLDSRSFGNSVDTELREIGC